MSTIAKPCIKMQPAAGLDINQFFNLVSEYVNFSRSDGGACHLPAFFEKTNQTAKKYRIFLS